jgi:hypothetical protein
VVCKPGRILDLERIDLGNCKVHSQHHHVEDVRLSGKGLSHTGACSSQGVWSTFTQSDVFALSRFSNPVQGRNGYLERGVGVDAMEVVKIRIEAKSVLCSLDVCLDVLFAVVDGLGTLVETLFNISVMSDNSDEVGNPR